MNDRIDELTTAMDRRDAGLECQGPRVAETTTAGAYPTEAGSWFVMSGLILLGSEEEGDEAEFGSDGATFMAFNLGDEVPPEGTRVICDLVAGGRWVFRYSRPPE